MKRILLTLALVSVLSVSCSKENVKENTSNIVTTNISSLIVSNLECANSAAVTADVKSKVDEVLKIQAEGNVVIEAFCKTVVDLVVPQVIGATLPTSWECKATTATSTVTDLIKEKGCDKL